MRKRVKGKLTPCISLHIVVLKCLVDLAFIGQKSLVGKLADMLDTSRFDTKYN